MEHKPGGYPAGCRCDPCRLAHNRRQREYSKTHRRPSVAKLNAELAELRAFRDGVLAARAVGREQVTS
jgi:hypothetical protein